MLSRLYLGLHYLGDVLAGSLLGLVLVVAAQRFWTLVRRWSAARSFQFFALLGALMLIGIIASIPFLGAARMAWQILGASGGGIIGLLLEYRYLHYVPVTQPLRRQVLKAIVGLTGLSVSCCSRAPSSAIADYCSRLRPTPWLPSGSL